MERDVAQKLFEMAQEYMPWRDRKKRLKWDDLPDEVKTVWHRKAVEIITIVEGYCPFSPKAQISGSHKE